MTFTTRPELRGPFGGVSSTHWLASTSAWGILQQGGNAFDAAVAAGFVLQVVEPHLNGPGGEVPILAYEAGRAEPFVICGQGTLPAAATEAYFDSLELDIMPGTGLLPACVPGAFGAWLTMLRDHGTCSLKSVLEPAIAYARRGYPLVPRIPNSISVVRELFETHWPSSAEVYLPNGSVPEEGRLFRNPWLADLYETIVREAAAAGSREAGIERALDYWYRGPVAEKIDRFCRENAVFDVSGRKHRGLLTADDMATWSPTVEKALSVDYHGHRVFKCGPWTQGPVLLQMLNLLSGYDIAAMDPLGPEFVHVVAEVTKLAMADRDTWYGDGGEVPIEALLSKSYADERRALIGEKASFDFRPGNPGGAEPVLPPRRENDGTVRDHLAGGVGPTRARDGARTIDRDGEALLTPDGAHRGDTVHVDVVDRWGNMVAATPSGGWFQSSPVIPGLGFPLTTRGQVFWLERGLNSSIKPRTRPRTTLTPSMAFRGETPYLAFGTPGGDQQDQWSLLLFLHHVHHGMNLQEAIDAPAFHTEHLVNSFWPREIAYGSLSLESRFPESTIEALRQRGHQVNVGHAWSEGRLSACAREGEGADYIVKAAANPRGMQGYAIVS